MSKHYVLKKNGLYYAHDDRGYVINVLNAELYTKEYAESYAALKQAERSFSKEAIEHYRKALIRLNNELQCLRKNYLTSSHLKHPPMVD